MNRSAHLPLRGDPEPVLRAVRHGKRSRAYFAAPNLRACTSRTATSEGDTPAMRLA
jgi:hypothetical protein